MTPTVHFLAGWALGLPVDLSRRDRALVVLASVSPDADALPAVIDFAQGRALDSLELGSLYHHSAHNIAFAMVISLACLAIAQRRRATGVLAFLAIHLHYASDMVGSRGPDGYQWPIPYLRPFSSSWQLTVPWQWELNAWPNMLIGAALLALALYTAWSRGYSPIGIFSGRVDEAFVRMLRRRFGVPSGVSHNKSF